MKLFGGRKHERTSPPVQNQTVPSVQDVQDMSATDILDEIQMEVQAMEAASGSPESPASGTEPLTPEAAVPEPSEAVPSAEASAESQDA